jgi:hypothetical protein
MNQLAKNRLEAYIRIRLFSTVAGLPVNARATALFALLFLVETDMLTAGTAQADGRGRYRGATADRKATAKALRAMLRKINITAKTLDPGEFPGAALQFRPPYSSSYQALIATALAIKTAASEAAIKPALIARGMDADFDVELGDLIEALQEATDRKFEGRGVQVGGTTVLLSASRRGLPYVRELDAIMQNILAELPLLLANWKSASHIQRPSYHTTPPTDGGGSGSGSGTGGSGPTPPPGS